MNFMHKKFISQFNKYLNMKIINFTKSDKILKTRMGSYESQIRYARPGRSFWWWPQAKGGFSCANYEVGGGF